MNVKNLRDWLNFVMEQDPAAAKMQVVVEPKKSWKYYHLSSGFAKRCQHNKKPVLVWRQAK